MSFIIFILKEAIENSIYIRKIAFTKDDLIPEAAKECLYQANSAWKDPNHISNKVLIDMQSHMTAGRPIDVIRIYKDELYDKDYEKIPNYSISRYYIDGQMPDGWGNDDAKAKKIIKSKKIGHSCSKCKSYNEYAEANQPDDSYMCRSCSIFTNIFSP